MSETSQQHERKKGERDLSSDLASLGSETVKEDGSVLHALGSGARKVRGEPDGRVLHVRVETGLDGHVVWGKGLVCCHLSVSLVSCVLWSSEKKEKEKSVFFSVCVFTETMIKEGRMTPDDADPRMRVRRGQSGRFTEGPWKRIHEHRWHHRATGRQLWRAARRRCRGRDHRGRSRIRIAVCF